MSYFEEQMAAWMANGCQGQIEEVDPFDMIDDEIMAALAEPTESTRREAADIGVTLPRRVQCALCGKWVSEVGLRQHSEAKHHGRTPEAVAP